MMFIPAVVSAVVTLIAYIKHYAWLKNVEPKHGDILNIRKEG